MVDPIRAAKRIAEENAKESAVLALRRSRAAEMGKELGKKIIAAHPETRRVWGFGSAYETWRDFRMTSDIDLAVESGDIMDLISITEACDIPVDIVDLSSCHPSMAAFIRAQGTILAEAGK